MNDLELRMNFLEQQGQRSISIDGQKIESFASLVIAYDEMLGLIKSRQNLDVLQKFTLKNRLDDLIRNSISVF